LFGLSAEEINKLVRAYEAKNLDTLTANRKTLIQGNSMGALAIMLLDEETREEMFRCEPYLDTFVSLATDQPGVVNPDAERDEFVDSRQVWLLLFPLRRVPRHTVVTFNYTPQSSTEFYLIAFRYTVTGLVLLPIYDACIPYGITLFSFDTLPDFGS
jgi:hypothetical protein